MKGRTGAGEDEEGGEGVEESEEDGGGRSLKPGKTPATVEMGQLFQYIA